MHSIDLLPNEGIIAQFDNVGCESPDFKGFERGELTLTNMSLVFTYTQIKMFGKDIDHTFSWALRDIKVVNGKPQLIVDKGESHQCDVLLRKGKIELRMGSHADLSKLVNGINKEITGSDEDVVGAPKTFISGIASMLTGATKEMAEAFTMSGLTKPAGAKKVLRACLGCGAALYGTEGTSVICEYCGRTEQL
ncbi:hypothetical protein [Bifidobacterium pseudolongum]|uniref:Uncharacterized protein n=1 Tax=Bifidobacterium pseudolongum subsp. globosum TaxID=1690 RepID=A0A2N3R7X8_9BIFI|nr:hypothetical protein [Bifidobacterium pseudolongum]PKV05457.1 hypothetical protein CQR50_0712 [Bifidobacterium pseudolongum subsp. globosum]